MRLRKCHLHPKATVLQFIRSQTNEILTMQHILDPLLLKSSSFCWAVGDPAWVKRGFLKSSHKLVGRFPESGTQVGQNRTCLACVPGPSGISLAPVSNRPYLFLSLPYPFSSPPYREGSRRVCIMRSLSYTCNEWMLNPPCLSSSAAFKPEGKEARSSSSLDCRSFSS